MGRPVSHSCLARCIHAEPTSWEPVSDPCRPVGLYSGRPCPPVCMLDCVYLCERVPVCIRACQGWRLCVRLPASASAGHVVLVCPYWCVWGVFPHVCRSTWMRIGLST